MEFPFAYSNKFFQENISFLMVKEDRENLNITDNMEKVKKWKTKENNFKFVQSKINFY